MKENAETFESVEDITFDTNVDSNDQEVVALVQQIHIDLQATNTLIFAQSCFLCLFIGFYLARVVWSKFVY